MDQTLQQLVADGDARNAELQRSRARILTTMEDERRRLERDIHDGAQQHLVALAVNLRLLRVLVTRDPARARSTAVMVRAALLNAVRDAGAALRRAVPLRARRGRARGGPPAGGRCQPGPGDRARRRTPPAAHRGRAHRLLQLPGGVAERDQARRRPTHRGHLDPGGGCLGLRGGRRRARVRPDRSPRPDQDGSIWPTGFRGAGGQLTVSSAPGRGTTVSGWIPAVEVPTLSAVS